MKTSESANDMNSTPTEKAKIIIGFFLLGVLLLVYDEICLTAAEDIISGSRISTTSVVIAIASSVLVVQTIVPWFLQKCSYLCKSCITACLLLTGLLVIVWAEKINVRLFGISVIEAGVSFGEITFLALTAFYHDVTVSALVTGFGSASIVGPLYYTGLTTWLCITPRITVLTTIPWPFLIIILYYCTLDKKDDTVVSKSEQHKDVTYTRLSGSADCDDGEVPRVQQDPLTLKEKFLVAKQISPFMTFLFLTYFAEYLSNQSIITTLAFSNSSFSPRDHYQYYMICYQLGKFLGRSHIFVLTCACANLVPYVRIQRTWILALIGLAHMFFFLTSSWFRFVPHVSIILALCFTEGFVVGSMFLNSIYTVSEKITDPTKREFALSLLTIGDAFGKLTAGMLGLHLEQQLKSHCMIDLKLGNNCITRHQKASGWSRANEQCLTNHHQFMKFNITISNSTAL
ncbi:battenin-like [Acropora millepora]|uniref:battenin-like n=1 Tax=Acropora millepora TaxID=45264 RepID=UPI001CF3E978|nr:battenin-like [Acropora millepora]